MRTERPRLSRHAPVAKAIDYMLKRWDGFTRFLDDGRICMTNNAGKERSAGLRWEDASRGCSAVPTAGAYAPRRCTPSSSPPSLTTSTRRLGSPMSSPASPSCRTPVCTNSCPGTGKTPGSRPWPRRPALTSRSVFDPPEPRERASRPSVLTGWVRSTFAPPFAIPAERREALANGAAEVGTGAQGRFLFCCGWCLRGAWHGTGVRRERG